MIKHVEELVSLLIAFQITIYMRITAECSEHFVLFLEKILINGWLGYAALALVAPIVRISSTFDQIS